MAKISNVVGAEISVKKYQRIKIYIYIDTIDKYVYTDTFTYMYSQALPCTNFCIVYFKSIKFSIQIL